MKDTETKQRFIELRAQGWSYARISEEIKVSKPTLVEWSKDLKIQVAVDNAHAMILENLKEQFGLMQEERLRFFAERLKDLRGEFKKRELSEVPVDKLLDMILKVEQKVNQLEGNVSFAEIVQSSDLDELMDGLNTDAVKDRKREWVPA